MGRSKFYSGIMHYMRGGNVDYQFAKFNFICRPTSIISKQTLSFSFLLLFFLFSIGSVSAQVHTQILDSDLRQVFEFYDYGSPPVVYAPSVNVDSILNDINSAAFDNNRFGVRKDLLVNKHDGHFYELEDGMLLWKLRIQASNASSISFQASKLILPESAEMYVHNSDNKMIMGPITNQVIHGSYFASDLIYGQNIVLSVKLRKVEKHEFNIQINNVTIGVVERSNRGFADSAPCNESMNVRCPDYNAWNNYKDAVCLILTAAGGVATGSLLNTDCIEYRAYVLTARHILNNNQPKDLIFRFNYESTTCDPPTEPRSWISFSGSTLLASWISTDFALLQMNGNLFGHTQLGLSGWDRSDYVPNTWSNFIHHPLADVKKIALNWEGGVLEPDEKFLSQGGSLAPNASIRHQWNHTLLDIFGVPYPATEGVLQPGSSGAPMYSQYNFNGRIIAQHSASSMQGNCDSIIETWAGRLHNSWLGGGTLNSSLDFWLGYYYNPMTADFVRVPGISGLNFICSGSTYIYSFVNPPPNRLNRTWTVSPSGYFTGSTSGTGTSASLTPLYGASGLATLTYTMSGDLISNDLYFTKKIWMENLHRVKSLF